jgi:hypothetical protein
MVVFTKRARDEEPFRRVSRVRRLANDTSNESQQWQKCFGSRAAQSFHLSQVANGFGDCSARALGQIARGRRCWNWMRTRRAAHEKGSRETVEVEVTWRPDPSTVSSGEHWSALRYVYTPQYARTPFPLYRRVYLPSGGEKERRGKYTCLLCRELWNNFREKSSVARPDTYGNPRTVTCSVAAIARPQKSTTCDVASGTASGHPHAMLKKYVSCMRCDVCSFDLRASLTRCRAKGCAGFRETIFKKSVYKEDRR